MKSIFFEAQTGIIREVKSENTNFFQYEIPAYLRGFLESIVSRAKVSDNGLVYDPADQRRLELVFLRYKNSFGYRDSSVGVPALLLEQVSSLLSQYGLRMLYEALATENERRAFMADTHEKHLIALKLMKTAEKAAADVGNL